MVSFSETTTSGSAGESKKNYIVKSPLVSWKCGRPTAPTKYKGVFSDGKRYRKPATHNMEMPVSCGICTEISKNGDMWTNKSGYRTNPQKVVRAKRSGDHTGRSVPGSLHMLIRIPPKYSVSQIMGYLKGKSSLMILDRHANLKYQYGDRHFWARGY